MLSRDPSWEGSARPKRAQQRSINRVCPQS
jgi:hypothetical protein